MRFDDIGTAIDSVENNRTATWLNGKRAIVLSVQRQPGSNTIQIVDAINRIIPRFQTDLPSSVKLTIIYDRSQSIRASVADVQITLLIAAVLVVAVIFLFLRTLSATIIPSLALPITMLGTFAGMCAAGLQPGQSFADGADPVGGLRRRRRHRDAGKHRPPCRGGRGAPRGRLQGLGRDRLHHPVA